jgi:predicted RNA-binding Zn-ribbon protein involved in translation (DUF1610 family)
VRPLNPPIGGAGPSWWGTLHPLVKALLWVVFLLALILVVDYILRSSANLKCPQCGTPLAPYEPPVRVEKLGGRDIVMGADVIIWTCEKCGWREKRIRGAPHPTRRGM